MSKVCEYFLRGKCNFGDRCRNEHPQGNRSGFGQSAAQSLMNRGQSNTTNALAGIGSGAFGSNTQSRGFGGNVGGGAFGQTGGGSAFGQTGSGSAFGQTRSGTFGHTGSGSAFGQTSGGSAFAQRGGSGGAFGSTGGHAFSQPTQSKSFGNTGTSAVGQTASRTFGSTDSTAFGNTANTGRSAFGNTGGGVFGTTGGSAFGTTAATGGGFGQFAQQQQQQQSGFPTPPAKERPIGTLTAGTTDEKLSKLSDDLLKKIASERPNWRISSFGPISNEPNMLSGMDMSPEEARLEYMLARNSGTVAQYEQKYAQLENTVSQALQNIIKDPASAVSDWVKSSGMAVSQEALAKRNLPKDASAKPPFGQSTTQTAFGQTPSGSAFGQTTTPPGAFGQPSSGSAFGQSVGSAFGNTTPAGAFGQQSAFGQSSAVGGFSKPAGGAMNMPSFGSTPEEIKRNTGPSRELTEAEISSFEAPDFNFGEIPEMPPTIALRQG